MSPTGAEARERLQQISFIVVQLGKEWYPHFHIDKGGGGGGVDASKAACVLHSIVETNAGAEAEPAGNMRRAASVHAPRRMYIRAAMRRPAVKRGKYERTQRLSKASVA